MPRILPVHRIAFPVSVAGLAVLLWLALHADLTSAPHWPLALALLGPGVVIGELTAVKVPRRGHYEEVTLSTAFTFALVITAGVLPACAALVFASVLQDVWARKPWWRVLFNIGQYTLATAAAGVVLALLTPVPRVVGHVPFAAVDLPGIILAAAAMFIVNFVIVSAAVAVHEQVPILDYARRDLAFNAGCDIVLHSLSPIVVASMHFTPWLIPMIVLPLLGVALFGHESAARVRHQATHDALTGLPSRSLLTDRIREAVDRAGSRGTQPALMLIDLDRFKEINDTLGHHYGDLLLREVGPRVQSELGPADTLARLGGDEFVVLAPNVRDTDEALELAGRLNAAIRQPLEIDHTLVDVDASIGIACFPEHGDSADELLKRADVAMYTAKRTQSGPVVYSAKNDPHSRDRLRLAGELRNAISQDELVLYYQAQVDATTLETVAVEALVRWRHPTRGLVSPGEFVPVAEAIGLTPALTAWVLDAALRQAAIWQLEATPRPIAVNVPPSALYDRRLVEEVRAGLEAHGVPANGLVVEITETTMMIDPERATRVLQELHELGVAVAVDDFGVGHSSLAYLRDLPIEQVKIDRSFIFDFVRGEPIVRAVVDLGTSIGLQVVAEGVEDEATAIALRDMGCHVLQGFLFARPVPPEELRPASSWATRPYPRRQPLAA